MRIERKPFKGHVKVSKIAQGECFKRPCGEDIYMVTNRFTGFSNETQRIIAVNLRSGIVSDYLPAFAVIPITAFVYIEEE